MKTLKISVLYKGKSSEKDVSKITGKMIAQVCKEEGYKFSLINPARYKPANLIKELKKSDLTFIALHGGFGENGQLQALLEMEGIKYTGSPFLSSCISMDKFISTQLAQNNNIPTPKNMIISKNTSYSIPSIVEKLKLPLIVKPNSSGSSLGITVVKEIKKMENAIKNGFLFDNNILCEQFIKGREMTVSILDDKPLPVVEIKPKTGFYDYKNKYIKGNSEYFVPAKISDKDRKIVQGYAKKLFKIFGCKIYSRFDFIFDETIFYFLENNTLPGMTPLSLTPMAAKSKGIDFNQLIKKIIKLSLL